MKALSHQPMSRLPRIPASRSGFTLLELMIVIVIIGLLVGLVLPAINSARVRARIVEVKKDISDLEQGIAQFKVSFGIEPPSQITLYAAAGDWDAPPPSPFSPANKRHKGLIKQMWPKFDFSNCGGASNGANFPGLAAGVPINLNGAECLVFFLGGMIDGSSGSFTGFAKDPAHPFSPSSGAGAITNREGPFFEFKGALNTSSLTFVGRLTDLDRDMVPEYRDPWPGQTNPYVYFNGVSGYQTQPMPPVAIPADAPGPPPTWRNTDGMYLSSSGLQMPHAYYSAFSPTSVTASRPQKIRGIQIISPGTDGAYGIGRLFDPTNTSSLYREDKDNITNFHTGRLGE